MPKYKVDVSRYAVLCETWEIEAPTAEQARKVAEERAEAWPTPRGRLSWIGMNTTAYHENDENMSHPLAWDHTVVFDQCDGVSKGVA